MYDRYYMIFRNVSEISIGDFKSQGYFIVRLRRIAMDRFE